MSTLRHPSLMPIQAIHVTSNQMYVLMELADSSLLDRDRECRMAGQNGIPLDELLEYIRDVAEALDYMHNLNVLHRDVKPHNIRLVRGHAKLSGFSLVQRVPHSYHPVPMPGCGTPVYMAPEVWENKFSTRSDQYSLAATYSELRLGRPLFANPDMYEIMQAHLLHEPDLSPLAEGEKRVLLRSLHKEANKRFSYCLDLWQGLEGELGARPRRMRLSQQNYCRDRSLLERGS